MQAFLPANHGALAAPAVALDPTPLQSHDRAVMAVLQGIGRVNASVLQLGASGGLVSEVDQYWRTALLEDLIGALDGLGEELDALLAAEVAVLSPADASDKEGLRAAVLAAVLAAQLREITEDCAICTDACQEPGGGSCSCLAEIGG